MDWPSSARTERDILRLVARGLATKQIARELDPPRAEGTAKTHLKTRLFGIGRVQSHRSDRLVGAVWRRLTCRD